MTNVTKYAQATHACLSVTDAGGVLMLEVSDDGVGGADPERGSGLRGLSDRVAALDGELIVDSPVGRRHARDGVDSMRRRRGHDRPAAASC